MFKRTKVCTGVLAALGGAMGVAALPALAQQQLDRVEVTGSSVRRIDAESALPVRVLKREDIERSGATSTVDLLQKLSSVQGSTGESSAVGGGSFGFSGVSIHNVGETRTLVLLNGHRLAQFGGQALTGFGAGMDLNSIPISAIERVDVLTDGASAQYGADAIAGVVNFITKSDVTTGDVTVGFSNPKGGAKEKRISATKGFGSLAENGFNVVLSFGHDERTQLNSKERDFANTGKVFFDYQGKKYRFQQFSASGIPANAVDDAGNAFSPYLKANGVCPPKSFRVIDGADDYCGFDFVGELEIFPERKRDSFMGSLRGKVGDQTLFLDVLASKTEQISRIAPVPGSISIPAGSPLHDTYLAPWGVTGDSTALYRLYDLGKRENDDTSKFFDVALGSKGTVSAWDYDATYSHSRSDVKGNISGYPGAIAIANLRASGLLNPFVLPGQQTPEAQAAINAVNYKGYWDGGTSDLDTLAVHGSREIFQMANGPAMMGIGANFNKEKFQSKPSQFAQGVLSDPVAGTLCDPALDNCDQRFGDGAATKPYSADRKSYGLFGELVLPVTKSLEVTGQLRYDHYSDFGTATTAKGSFRWTPDKTVLIRGSVGSGFHAPTVPQVNAAKQAFGVTSDKYACSAEMLQIATSLGATCRPGTAQYDQIAGGNADLKAEKSIQGTLGIRIEPNTNLSFGADLWHVGIRDAFGQLTEQEVFAHPLQYQSSWSKTRDVGTGADYLAFVADNQNLGKSYSTGIDFDISGRAKTSVGDVTSQVTATYMIREVSQLLRDGPYYSSIGDNSELGVVTFRWKGKWMNSLRTDHWQHTFTVNFQSGYKDQATDVTPVDAAGNPTGADETIRLDVKKYFTLDWQTMWTPTKSIALTVGLLNVFNTDPPFSLSTAGINKGQQFGYDDRYYDSRGRTAFVNASYKF